MIHTRETKLVTRDRIAPSKAENELTDQDSAMEHSVGRGCEGRQMHRLFLLSLLQARRRPSEAAKYIRDIKAT